MEPKGLYILKEVFIMSIKTLLHEEIESEFKELEKTQVGTDQYKASIDGISKLIDRSIEISKIEADIKNKEDTREIETQLELKKQKDERRNKIIVNVLTGTSIISGIVLTVWGTLKTLKFEETGTVTTSAGRSFINGIVKSFTKH